MGLHTTGGGRVSVLQAVLIGAGGGLVIGLVSISVMYRSVWGHWRFWRFEIKHRRPR